MITNPLIPTPAEAEQVLAAIRYGQRPSSYRLRCFYDQALSLPVAIEEYEPTTSALSKGVTYGI